MTSSVRAAIGWEGDIEHPRDAGELIRELSQTLGVRGLPQIDLWRPD